MLRWFDAHLDLAMLAELGRDLRLPLDRCGGPDAPAAISFPALHEGNVTHVLGTIFTEADGPADQTITYRSGDAEGANAAGLRQLKRYQEWYRPHFYRQMSEHTSEAPGPAREPADAPEFLILMEGADPILDPDDLGFWREQGVVAVGLAWMKASRYAGGNATQIGITDAGRALVREMDRLGVVHDASHLSDRAFSDLCGCTDRPIIASHSNCRSIIASRPFDQSAIPEQLRDHPDPMKLILQRHLTDGQIREIAARGGVIGLNLYSSFLIPGGSRTYRATIDHCMAHIEHICMLAGNRKQVGLGSDMDGGFSAARLPEGIDAPRDLHKLAGALRSRGWNDSDIGDFAWDNWARFWGIA
jgi:membrane dipeptidase